MPGPAPSARSGFTIEITEAPPYLIARWNGVPIPEVNPEGEPEAAAGAGSADHVVIDLTGLGEPYRNAAPLLGETITTAQRRGLSVTLVGCPEELYRKLRCAGVNGSVVHAPSLAVATGGRVGDPSADVELHLQSSPEMLHRLRNVVSAVSRRADLPEQTEIELKTAVTEAAANAILHGSPEGARNHVRIAFHLDRRALVVDVGDQGRGFDAADVPLPRVAEYPEHGFGLTLMRCSMDRVEFYRGETGMIVRLTKYLRARGSRWARDSR